MAYVGRSPRYGFLEGQSATFDGSTTTVTLQRSVSSTDAIDVYIDNVHQEPDEAYTLSDGGSSITFTGTPENGAVLYIRFHGISFDTTRAYRLENSDGGSTATLGDDDSFTLSLDGTTALSATSSGVTIANLTVTGTTTTVNSTDLNIGDNKITLNSDLPSDTAPTENAGIVVNRGSSPDVEFVWDESVGRWYSAKAVRTGSKFETLLSGSLPTIGSDVVGVFANSATNESAYISIIGNSAQYSGILFGDENASNTGWLRLQHSNNVLYTNVPLNVNGNVTASGLRTNDIGKSVTNSPITLNAGNNNKALRVYYDMDVYNTISFTNASWENQGKIQGLSNDLVYRSAQHHFKNADSSATFATVDSGGVDINGGRLIANASTPITNYASELRVTDANVQLLLGRDGSSAGSGGIGANADYAFLVYSTSNGALDTQRFDIDHSGNVTADGSATFGDTVQITSGANLSTLNADGWLLIGSESSYNMAFDENEIQARNNGAANQLVLQKNGGNTSFGTTDTQMWDNNAGGSTGVVIHADGYISAAASGLSPYEANRLDSEGNIINMRVNGAIRGRLKTYAANEFGIRSEKHFLNLTANATNSGLTYWNDGGSNHYFKPFDGETGNISLGKASAKWADFWMTGTAYIDGSVAIGSDHAPSAAYGPTAHIKGSNPNVRLEGTGTGSWAYFELNNSNYERSFGMSTDGTFRITDQRGDMDNGIQLQLQQNGRFNVLETISAGTVTSALKGYFYENTADQNGTGKPTSVLGVAAYTNSNGEGPSIDFSSVWSGSAIYQQDNWNEGWTVARVAGVYDYQVSNGGALAFYTHSGTSASGGAGNSQVTEKLRIKPNGYVYNTGDNHGLISVAVAGQGGPSSGNVQYSSLQLNTKGNASGVTRSANWQIRAHPESAWGNPSLDFRKYYDGTDYGIMASISSGGNFTAQGNVIGNTIQSNRNNNANYDTATSTSNHRIYPSFYDGYSGAGRFHFRTMPVSTDSSPRLVVRLGTTPQEVTGKIQIAINDRTNSPSNAQFRHMWKEYSFGAYTEGDADGSAGRWLTELHSVGGSQISGYGNYYVHTGHANYNTNSDPWHNSYMYYYWDFTGVQGHPVNVTIDCNRGANYVWYYWWE